MQLIHYTSNLITYSKNNVGKLGVVAYGKRTSTTKMTYIKNSDKLDLTGGILLIEYSDNFTKEVSLENEDTLVVEINKEKNMIIINYLDYQIPIEGTKNNNKSLIYVLVFGVTTIMSFIISLILKKKYKVKQ